MPHACINGVLLPPALLPAGPSTPPGLLSELHTLILDEAGMTSAEMLQVLDTYITCGRKKAILWMKGELVEVRRITAASPVHPCPAGWARALILCSPFPPCSQARHVDRPFGPTPPVCVPYCPTGAVEGAAGGCGPAVRGAAGHPQRGRLPVSRSSWVWAGLRQLGGADVRWAGSACCGPSVGSLGHAVLVSSSPLMLQALLPVTSAA